MLLKILQQRDALLLEDQRTAGIPTDYRSITVFGGRFSCRAFNGLFTL